MPYSGAQSFGSLATSTKQQLKPQARNSGKLVGSKDKSKGRGGHLKAGSTDQATTAGAHHKRSISYKGNQEPLCLVQSAHMT